MTTKNVDALARTASRRGSLQALGGAWLATLPAAIGVEAKSKGGKLTKKKCKAKCKAQVGQCQTVLEIACTEASDPEDCRQQLLPCCDQAATCNAGAMLSCVLSGGQA
jgi:hypothetical protein